MGHIPHLVIPGSWGEQPTLDATAEQVHHLRRVLRRGPEAAVSYTDGNGLMGTGTWTGEAIRRGRESVVAPPTLRLRMAVAAPRSSERQRFLVEKLAELGVAELTWLDTTRGSAKPPRADRSRAWAVAALEQSRGAYLMEVETATEPAAALPPPLLVADPEGIPLRQAVPADPANLAVAVGPEGGLTRDEIPDHAVPIVLGRRILRVETAAIVAAALLLVNT